MASFAIEPAFWELFPQAEIGIVVARGIDNAHESSEDVKAALAEANKAALAHVPDPTISKNPAVAVWREAFQQFKTKKGARSSIEALLKRASGGREVGSINPLVDIYNTVSLTYALPCGGEDIDTFAGDLRLTVTQGGDAAGRGVLPRRRRRGVPLLELARRRAHHAHREHDERVPHPGIRRPGAPRRPRSGPRRSCGPHPGGPRRRDGIPYRDEGQPGDRPVVSALVASVQPCGSAAFPVRP